MRHPIQEGSALPTIYRIPFLNTHTEPVPPYGIVQIVGATEVLEEDTEYFVTKPNGATTAKYLINGPTEVPPNEPGFGTDEYPSDIAYNPSSGTPSDNSVWGPRANFWTLHHQGTGFLILGGANLDEHIVRAAFLPGGGQDIFTKADPGDPQAKTLIENVRDAVPTGTYNATTHQLVLGEVNVDAGVHTVRFFTLPSGASSPSYFAGCGLDLLPGNFFKVNTFELVGPPGAPPTGGIYALNAGDCTWLAINHDCGLKITDEPGRPPGFKLRLDMNSLVGQGLDQSGATGECPKIAVDTGLGVTIDNTQDAGGEVALFRLGHTPESTRGEVYGYFGQHRHFTLGCGLEFDGGELRVNTSELVDGSTTTASLCKIHATQPPSFLEGCHISFVPSGSGSTFINVDPTGLRFPGSGLKTVPSPTLSPPCLSLAIDAGCGLAIDASGPDINKLRVDAMALRGQGLEVIAPPTGESANCLLHVNVGLGVILDPFRMEPTQEVAVYRKNYFPDRNQIYGHAANAPAEEFRHIDIGCGLKYMGGVLMVDNTQIAAESQGTLLANGNCGLIATGETPEPPIPYTAGCGIFISAANEISVNNTHLAGCGLKPGVGCSLDFDAMEVASDGLEPLTGTGECGLRVNIGCGLEFENDAPTKAVRVKLHPNGGLECLPTGLKVKEGCGIELATDGCVKVKPSDIAGPGLIPQPGGQSDCNGPCELAVNPGCGIEVVADKVQVKRADLISPTDGIIAGPGSCNLKVNATTEIKSFKSCELSVLPGEILRLKITYDKFLVYAIPLGEDESTCQLGGIDCENL
jgi:hypothetical protein